MHVGLYDVTTAIPAEGATLSWAVVPADASKVNARFTAIPSGAYALAVFQDLNGAGRLDTILGAADEPIGYSNGAKGSLTRPPSFKEAVFHVHQDQARIDVSL